MTSAPPDNQTPPAPKLNITETYLGKFEEGFISQTLTVSPDSKRVAYVAVRGEKSLVVVDGVEGKEYDGFVEGSRVVFDSPAKFHTLAVRDKEIFLVGIEITE